MKPLSTADIIVLTAIVSSYLTGLVLMYSLRILKAAENERQWPHSLCWGWFFLPLIIGYGSLIGIIQGIPQWWRVFRGRCPGCNGQSFHTDGIRSQCLTCGRRWIGFAGRLISSQKKADDAR
jgi:hypothetical protein